MDLSITELDLSNQNLTELPNLSIYPNLKILYCSNNQITELNNLPPSLVEFYCNNNQITEINYLPERLQDFNCLDNPFILNYDYQIDFQNIIKYNKDKELEKMQMSILK